MRTRCFIFLCFAATLVWVLQAVAGDMVEVRIDTVLATNASHDFDTRLGDMRRQLSAFRFSSYRLVQEERRQVGWGKQADFLLPGGRFLQVVPKGYVNEQIALHVMLMEGSTPTSLMSTDVRMPNPGALFIAGRPHQEGTLIIRIGVAASD
ncbi:MAG: hypothetical protein NZ578_17525 [Candidatus Binatia bacterium]|nr:hypothetical protein [Candidatus Binatia bacterium]